MYKKKAQYEIKLMIYKNMLPVSFITASVVYVVRRFSESYHHLYKEQNTLIGSSVQVMSHS